VNPDHMPMLVTCDNEARTDLVPDRDRHECSRDWLICTFDTASFYSTRSETVQRLLTPTAIVLFSKQQIAASHIDP
jgi:hypothetical protein